MRGLSEGTGIEYMAIVRIHMFPELIKAACSMLGSWGPAIKNTNGTLYQLRALDWVTNGPFQKYPALLVYHPESGNNFTTLTWTGFLGALTGFSSAPMGLSQKVWYSYNETDSRMGIPFHFLLRDILQFDVDMSSAISRIADAARTCAVWIGLGDYTNEFRIIEYSYDIVKVFDDINFPAYKYHPLLSGTVYIDKHPQPSFHPCLGSLMEEHYGNLDSMVIKTYISAQLQTGNLHIAVYDFSRMLMYVSNAAPYQKEQPLVCAYDRPYIRVDLNELFSIS